MKIISISPNLSVLENQSFGTYDHDIVHNLLRSIDINFSNSLDIPEFSTCNSLINFTESNPMCSNIKPNHLISLSVSGDFWCQWVYQFSHEYCHHLINGELSGVRSGLIWFEEIICELSSMYHLYLLHQQWSDSAEPRKKGYAKNFQSYLNELLQKNSELLSQTNESGWLESWSPLLSEDEYHRDHYNAIATKIFPLFVEYPSLWKIILQFGDMRSWGSLEELFDHLQSNAVGTDYIIPLEKLRTLLFS